MSESCVAVTDRFWLFAVGDEEAVKKSGKLRQQGKKYVVQDGDIIYFKFNV